MNEKLIFKLTAMLLGFSVMAFAQKVTVSGFVQDAGSKEVLIAANIYEPKMQTGTSTNSYGYFSLTLPAADTILLIVSYVGYKPETRKIVGTIDGRLDVLLLPSNVLREVEISGARNDDNVNQTRVGVIDVPTRDIQNVPVLMGERDILKAIQFLPGVQQAQEGTTGFFVRGGNLDQNLVLLDEAPVYNPNHLFGLVSTFNVNAVNHVQLIKGGFPAQYGGRLSSILDITMKDGNKEHYQAEGGIGLLSANLTVQGPIKKSKASFIVSGRRSYVDLFQKAFIPNNTTLYSFFDVNAKVNFELGKNDKIYFSAFKGRDNGSYTGPSSLNYAIGFGNSTATIRWSHIFGNNLFGNASFIANTYDLALSTEQGNYYSLFYTGIRDMNTKSDFTWTLNTNHVVRFGATYFYHTTSPSTFTDQIPKSGSRIKVDRNKIRKRHAIQMAAYINHEWDISENFGLNYGVRVSHYYADIRKYTLFEPRLTAKVNLNKTTSFKASYTEMNQFLHAIPYSSASFPTDIWIASSQRVKPQNSIQYSIGVFKNLKENLYEASIEAYHKEMSNQVLFRQGTNLTVESDIEESLTFGQGESYGAELFLKKNSGRLTGWFSYTWSRTTQTFPELNFGEPFPFTYDRRHSLAIVATFDINERWSIATDFVFRTGSAYTLPPGRVPVTDGTLYDGWYYDYTTRNNTRQRAYHRLDVSFSYKKERTIFGRKYQSEWVFGAYNIYARQNPYFIYMTVDPQTQQPQAKELSLLPIVPSVSFNFKF
ncbi:MAG: TonB-dependent receptor [Bacteroidota bacterium]